MVIRTLTNADFDAVHAAFTEAFSDYVVPLTLTREQLQEMLRRRGWVPEASVAVFDGERMVAFTLNGMEGDRGYDSGTGVVPTHRRRGHARELMERSIDLLRDRGCKSYVLEVLEQNEKAFALYRSLGFRETRRLQSWRYDAHSRTVSQSHSGEIDPVRLCDCETVRLWWDIEPSWQNSNGSIDRAHDPFITIGNDDGYAIVSPATGDLPQLAVRREARRRGIGTRLLEGAASLALHPLRIMNLDDRHEGIRRFLEHAGATRFVRQIEMERALLS